MFNYGRLQDLILLFKIPMDARYDFFEIDRKFWHAPTKPFTSPAVCRKNRFSENSVATYCCYLQLIKM